MQYRKLGNDGPEVSVLGFGCMRLPTIEKGGAIKRDEAIALIRKGIDNGINYVDTAWTYHGGESEVVLGLALKDGYREKVTLVTKIPVGHKDFTEGDSFFKFLDEELERLDVEYIDYYLLHALNKKSFDEKVVGLNVIERAMQAKKEGKIKHLGFSFHDTPEVLKEIIDTGWFDLVLVQYNILDQVNREMMAYARSKGMGVAVMGPVGGGRLAGEDLHEDMKPWLTPGRKNLVDLAFKFVHSNPDVCVALSGMGSDEMLDDNLALASRDDYDKLNEDEIKRIDNIATKFKELCDNICTQCKYCQPCPNDVNISFIFSTLQRYQIYGQQDMAKYHYSIIGKMPWAQGENASACVECGECLEKCPQNIEIIEQLKKAHEVLSEN